MMQRILLVFIGVAVLAKAIEAQIVRQPLSFEWCMTRSDDFYQDPYNCTRFVRCVGGIKYEFDCPVGTRWDSRVYTCNFDFATACNTTNYVEPPVTDSPTTPIYCPPNVASGFQRDPTDCTLYYWCNNGVPYRQRCPTGLFFTTYFNNCSSFENMSPSDQSYCSNLVTTPSPNVPYCPPQVVDGTQRDSTNCGRYYRCRNGAATLDNCPQELYYNPAFGTCTPFNDLSQTEKDFCNGITTPTTTPATNVPYCPPQVTNGTQRDSMNCGRYYRCLRGVASLEYCPQDLYYNPSFGSCSPFNDLAQTEKDICNGMITTTPPISVPFCPPQVASGTQRDSTNCGRYYRCLSGVASLEYCPQELYFNPTFGTCTPFNALSQTERDMCNGIITTTTPTTSPPSVFCPVQVTNGTQRDSTNCGRYYRCLSGSFELEYCPQELYYNPLFGSCTPFNALSTVERDFCNGLTTVPPTTPGVFCPPSVVDDYQRDPGNCTQYYRCVSGASYRYTCMSGQYFTTLSRSQPCGRFEDLSPSDQSRCAALEADRATDPAVYCPPQVPVGFMRDGMNCSQYYWCVNGVPYIQRCQTGLYYSTMLQACSVFDDMSPSDKALCSALAPTTPAPTVQCPPSLRFGQLPDPNNCTKYYQCQFGVSRQIDCLAGTYYNELSFRCDPPSELSIADYERCVGATTSPPNTNVACRGNNQGRLMDFYDQNCRTYFECRLGQITTTDSALQCALGTYFNDVSKSCTSFEQLPPTFQDYCRRV